MTVMGYIVFAVVDLSVLAAIKMICSAWVAVSATKKLGSEDVREIVEKVKENMDDD